MNQTERWHVITLGIDCGPVANVNPDSKSSPGD